MIWQTNYKNNSGCLAPPEICRFMSNAKMYLLDLFIDSIQSW